MRFRVMTALLALVLCADLAAAQSIGVFGDETGASCRIDVPSGGSGNAWILVVTGPLNGITGAEFRVTGLPAGWFASETPNENANIDLGSVYGDGANIAFPDCQEGSTVLLYQMNFFDADGDDNANVWTHEVEMKNPPSNPDFFSCPLVTMCDGPTFTKVCVATGQGFTNGQSECTVSVENKSWAALKHLYR